MPLNREARNKAIKLLRQYMGGKISNDHLLESWPRKEPDLDALFWQCAWPIVSDLEHHYHVGKHKLNKEGKSSIARVVLFLGTDQEYSWPAPSHWWLKSMLLSWVGTLVVWLISDKEWALLFFGTTWFLLGYVVGPFASKILLKRFKTHGDWEVWPFHTRVDFEAAKRKPRYLAGMPPRIFT